MAFVGDEPTTDKIETIIEFYKCFPIYVKRRQVTQTGMDLIMNQE
jgi:hypothetical protein